MQALLRHGPEVDMEQVAARQASANRSCTATSPTSRSSGSRSARWWRPGVVDAIAPAVEQVREERGLVEATIDAYWA